MLSDPITLCLSTRRYRAPMGTRSRPLVLAIAVTALLGACETAPAAPSVRTAPMTGPVPGDVRAIGARLVGSRWDRSGASRPVASSDGRHWRAVPLPGAPAGLYPSLGLTSTAAGVAFTGRALGPVPGTSLAGPSGPPYGWTSLDGVTWQGGRLATAAPLLTAVSAAAVDRRTTLVVSQPDATGLTVTRFDRRSHPTTVPVTGLTLAGVPGGIAGETAVADAGWTDAGAWVLGLRFAGSNPRPDAGRAVSTDRGRSWRYETCTPTGAPACAIRQSGAGLSFRADEVSTDRGRSWRRWIHPPTPQSYPLFVTGVSRDAAGWIMSAVVGTEGDSTYGFLLGSTDGISWRSLAPDPCPRLADGDRPNSSFTPPVRLDGRWWTQYRCDGIGRRYATWLLSGAADDRRWDRSALVLPRRVDGLFVVDDHLVSLVVGADGGSGRVVEIRP